MAPWSQLGTLTLLEVVKLWYVTGGGGSGLMEDIVLGSVLGDWDLEMIPAACRRLM